MRKVIQRAFGLAGLLVLLGALGVGIATLITVLNLQDTQTEHSEPTLPTLPTFFSNIPSPKPITTDDPRYKSYTEVSDLLTSWMNTSADPCNDFYEYTCGAGQKNQKMSLDAANDAMEESIISLLKDNSFFKNQPVPVQKAKWFFDVCSKSETDVQPADYEARSLRIFNDLRIANPGVGFPALFPTETNSASPEALGSILGYTIGTSSLSSLVEAKVETDWKDPHNAKGGYALFIDQPATFFTPTFYTKMYRDYEDEVVNGILDKINSAAVLLGVNIDQTQALQDAKDIAAFDFDLATKYSTDQTTRRQSERNYNPLSVDRLQKLAPFINWKNYFDNVLTSISLTVDDSFRTIAMEIDNLSRLSVDISSGVIASRTINNYIHMSFLNSLDLPKLTNEKTSIFKTFRRQKRSMSRGIRRETKFVEIESDFTHNEELCIFTIINDFTYVGSRLYIEANYPDEYSRTTVREQTNSIIRSVIVALRAQIDLIDWMSPASKKGAYQKIDNLVVNIAFPDWVLDDKQLSEYYKKVTIKSTDDYLTQLDALNAFGLYEDFSKLINRSPADRENFNQAPIANAWYQRDFNSICFGGGIVNAPFYNSNYPASVNYGGLGVVAGHELTHGFDDQGVQWEGTGILIGWMDENSTNSFTEMAQCVIDEYNQFCPVGTPCVDGAQSQGENIGDNGGIQVAYKAFKAFEALHGPDPLLPGDLSIFTADQLFFLSFAQVWCEYPPDVSILTKQILKDPHSPSLYRVLGTIQNFPAFQKAFNCPADSVYAPIHHCNVWTSEPTSGYPLNKKGEPLVVENDLNIAAVERISAQDSDRYTAYQSALHFLKSSADLSINPCDDFYNYTCGNYPGQQTQLRDAPQKTNRLISDKIEAAEYQITIMASTALTKLKKLYDACKSEAANPTISTTNYIEPMVTNLRKYLNHDIPLIGGNGEIKLAKEDYGMSLGYFSFQLGDDAGSAYVKMDKTAKLPANYEQLIDDALELEREISVSYTVDDFHQFNERWNPINKTDLPAEVDWDKFFSFTPKQTQDWINDPNNHLVFSEEDFVSRLFSVGLVDKDATVVNYLFIRLILSYSYLIPIPPEAQTTFTDMKNTENIGDDSRHRKPHRHAFSLQPKLDEINPYGAACASGIGYMDAAQGRVYIDARFPTEEDRETIKNATHGMVVNIVDAMKGMIQQLDWMTDLSKSKALNKISNVQVNLVFPDFIMDDAKLDAKYDDLEFADTDSYYEMLEKCMIYNINEQFKQLDATTVDREEFITAVANTNARYSPFLNSFTIAAGILQEPFFDFNYPVGLNYGGIGYIIGHELSHAFDSDGVQFYLDGRLESWMDEKSQAGFDTMAQCVIDEYYKFCPLPEDRHPHCNNGVQTEGENIADNGGIHAAWRAFEAHIELNGPEPLFMDRVYSQYTQNQLFFLSFAQSRCTQKTFLTESFVSNFLMVESHTLDPYRILGTLQNIPAFQANFNCPLGSTYAPQKHCNVWVPTNMA